jgi:phage terminase large subunit-like protein
MNKGLECVEVPQTYTVLTDPMQMIDVLLRKRLTVTTDAGEEIQIPALTHEPHPVARWAFGNTSIHKNGNAQIKYVKESKGKTLVRTKRIDPTAAWVIGMVRAKFYESRPDLSKIMQDDWGM